MPHSPSTPSPSPFLQQSTRSWHKVRQPALRAPDPEDFCRQFCAPLNRLSNAFGQPRFNKPLLHLPLPPRPPIAVYRSPIRLQILAPIWPSLLIGRETPAPLRKYFLCQIPNFFFLNMVIRATPPHTDNMDNTRTPQNTPASNAPISSRAQAPGVASIKEGSFASHHTFTAIGDELTLLSQRTLTAPQQHPSSHRTQS